MWLVIVYTLVFAVSNAMLTMLIDYCLGGVSNNNEAIGGRIFSSLGRYLLKKYYDFEDVEMEKHNEKIIASGTFDLPEHSRVNYWKIFVCPICLNVWLGIFTGIALVMGGFLTWWFFVPYIVISSYLLRLQRAL